MQNVKSPKIHTDINSDFVVQFMNQVNAKNAARVYGEIANKFELSDLSEKERKAFSVHLDSHAVFGMEEDLHSSEFITRIKGCEGAKEETKYGEEARVPVLGGHYGLSHEVNFDSRHELESFISHKIVEVVVDPIEGTTNASFGRPGSISIIAGILDGEISIIPSEDEARYMDRIVAPPRVKESGVTLDNSVEKNIELIKKAFKMENSSDIEAVIMNRPRNEHYINDLRRLGVKLRLIDSGDLLPALGVFVNDNPIISLGSGGKEEAIIAAIVAKAVGGVFEGRFVEKDGSPAMSEFGNLFTIDELISGNQSNTFLSFASITGTKGINDMDGNVFNLGKIGLPSVKIDRDKKMNISGIYLSGKTGSVQKYSVSL